MNSGSKHEMSRRELISGTAAVAGVALASQLGNGLNAAEPETQAKAGVQARPELVVQPVHGGPTAGIGKALLVVGHVAGIGHIVQTLVRTPVERYLVVELARRREVLPKGHLHFAPAAVRQHVKLRCVLHDAALHKRTQLRGAFNRVFFSNSVGMMMSATAVFAIMLPFV